VIRPYGPKIILVKNVIRAEKFGSKSNLLSVQVWEAES
jgi:hypothetical protein